MKELKKFIYFLVFIAVLITAYGKLLPSSTSEYSVANIDAASYGRIKSSIAPTVMPSPTPSPSPTPTNTPKPTPSPTPWPTAQIGDRGDAVMQIQQRLVDLGYLKGAVDGIYGNQTARAVKAFQNAIDVEATGIVDKNISRSLFFAYAKAAATAIIANTPKATAKAKKAYDFPDYRNSASKGTKYVLNTNTRKFHKSSCRYVKKIKPKNYKEYTGTREEVIKMGYVACKVCYP